jgi:hypothetical protein
MINQHTIHNIFSNHHSITIHKSNFHEEKIKVDLQALKHLTPFFNLILREIKSFAPFELKAVIVQIQLFFLLPYLTPNLILIQTLHPYLLYCEIQVRHIQRTIKALVKLFSEDKYLQWITFLSGKKNSIPDTKIKISRLLLWD